MKVSNSNNKLEIKQAIQAINNKLDKLCFSLPIFEQVDL